MLWYIIVIIVNLAGASNQHCACFLLAVHFSKEEDKLILWGKVETERTPLDKTRRGQERELQKWQKLQRW